MLRWIHPYINRSILEDHLRFSKVELLWYKSLSSLTSLWGNYTRLIMFVSERFCLPTLTHFSHFKLWCFSWLWARVARYSVMNCCEYYINLGHSCQGLSVDASVACMTSSPTQYITLHYIIQHYLGVVNKFPEFFKLPYDFRWYRMMTIEWQTTVKCGFKWWAMLCYSS